MNTPTTQAGTSRPKTIGIALALVLATAMGGMVVAPALAKDEGHDRGRQAKAVHDRGHDRGYDDRGRREYGYGARYYQEPVYVPPPVYYAPEQSPGISIFLPLNIRLH